MADSAQKVVPPTKLWGDAIQGYVIVLKCVCGVGVDYPGHPDERTVVTCSNCGQRWAVEEDGVSQAERYGYTQIK